MRWPQKMELRIDLNAINTIWCQVKVVERTRIHLTSVIERTVLKWSVLYPFDSKCFSDYLAQKKKAFWVNENFILPRSSVYYFVLYIYIYILKYIQKSSFIWTKRLDTYFFLIKKSFLFNSLFSNMSTLSTKYRNFF